MAGANLVVADDERALAALVAQHVVAIGREAIGRHGTFSLALSGGSTPRAAYAVLASAPHRDALDWDRVRFFFGDERCVAPDHADSNYRMAREALLDPLAIDADAVFRMHGEDEPAVAAESYAKALVARLGERPAFDCIMLGIGPDGHTASLFPGTDPTLDSASLVRAPYVDKLSTYRLTITPHVINAARNVVVSVAGDAKAAALRAIIEGSASPTDVPARIVAPTSGTLTWLVDLAATARLTGR